MVNFNFNLAKNGPICEKTYLKKIMKVPKKYMKIKNKINAIDINKLVIYLEENVIV